MRARSTPKFTEDITSMSPSDPVTELKYRPAEVHPTEALTVVAADKLRALRFATEVPDRIFRW